jgi:hypothetical protein
MSRLRRARRWWPAIPIVIIVLLILAAWPGRSTYTVSEQTTLVTDHVDPQGMVDYPTALNERMSKGITPENNAKVLIWQALGPHPERGTMPPEYFKWLGIAQPPEQGEYFVGWHDYFQLNLKTPPDDILELFDDEPDWQQSWDGQVERARKWPWKAEEQGAIADWLKQNEKPLALVIEASKRPQYYNPLVSKSQDPKQARLIGSLLPSVQKCRELARALNCRAMRRLAEGDFDAAWQDLLAAQRLGRLMMRGSGSLIETLVGTAMIAITTEAQITFLSHSKHSSKQLLAWLDDLKKLPPIPPLGDKMDLGERFMVLDTLQSLATGGVKQLEQLSGPGGTTSVTHPFWDKLFTRSIDWDPAFRNANRMFDRLAAASRLPDRVTRTAEMSKIESEIKQMQADIRETGPFEKAAIGKSERGEMIGNILLTLLLPSVQKVQAANDRIEQQQRNLQVAVALAAYRADNGKYPANLDDLAPNYLAKVPGDSFSGKPLVYKPTENGYLFYSVGVNGIDEEGRWIDDTPKGDDLRVRMPVPEPAEKKKEPGANPLNQGGRVID